MPSFYEPLRELTSALKGDAGLTALVPADNIRNHLGNENTLPWIRFRYDPGAEYDDKGNSGLDGVFVIDCWTDRNSDKPLMLMMDNTYRILHRNPFPGTTSQSLLLHYVSSTTFIEPDGVTHHGVINFRYVQVDG